MENPVDQQRLNEYQSRMSDWIGRQGVLFQIRYARTVGSRSIVKLLLLLIVVGICGFLLLNQHFDSPEYKKEISDQLAEVLGAEEIEVSGFSRNTKSGEFLHLNVKGGEKSFFYEATFERFGGMFSFLTGVTESWQPSAIRIKKADVNLKAGGGKEEMVLGFSSVVESLEGKGLSQIKVDDCSFDWGYSKLTFGAVRNTNLKATLQGGVWEVALSGGTFQQNWLGPLEIESAALTLDESGIEVMSLKLKMDGGAANIEGKISGPANMPTFDLKGGFTSLPLERFINIRGVKTRQYIEGKISGELVIGGSSNRRIELSGKVKLEENDRVTIRERWSLLRALSILDRDRTYLRIDFDQGGFSFSTGGGEMKVEGIDLTAGSKARLLGDVATRLPTQEEAAKALGIKLTDGFWADYTDSSAAQQLENDRMRIDRSADDEGFGVDIDGSVEDGKLRITQDQLSGKEVEAIRMKDEMDIHRITGELKIAVPAAAFSGSEALVKLYPEDEQGWRWVPVKLVDASFMTIGDRAEELLFKQARGQSSGPSENN